MKLIVFLLSMAASVHAFGQPASSDAAAAEAAVRAFHQALAGGDAKGALRLLSPDAVILESGASETRAEYAAHHLAADIEFARAVPMQRGPLRVTVNGDTAWVASTGKLRGTFQARTIDVVTAELMVLSRTASGWEIRAIHWSSQ
jgi:ketosteroid isomerase-like protein